MANALDFLAELQKKREPPVDPHITRAVEADKKQKKKKQDQKSSFFQYQRDLKEHQDKQQREYLKERQRIWLGGKPKKEPKPKKPPKTGYVPPPSFPSQRHAKDAQEYLLDRAEAAELQAFDPAKIWFGDWQVRDEIRRRKDAERREIRELSAKARMVRDDPFTPPSDAASPLLMLIAGIGDPPITTRDKNFGNTNNPTNWELIQAVNAVNEFGSTKDIESLDLGILERKDSVAAQVMPESRLFLGIIGQDDVEEEFKLSKGFLQMDPMGESTALDNYVPIAEMLREAEGGPMISVSPHKWGAITENTILTAPEDVLGNNRGLTKPQLKTLVEGGAIEANSTQQEIMQAGIPGLNSGILRRFLDDITEEIEGIPGATYMFATAIGMDFADIASVPLSGLPGMEEMGIKGDLSPGRIRAIAEVMPRGFWEAMTDPVNHPGRFVFTWGTLGLGLAGGVLATTVRVPAVVKAIKSGAPLRVAAHEYFVSARPGRYVMDNGVEYELSRQSAIAVLQVQRLNRGKNNPDVPLTWFPGKQFLSIGLTRRMAEHTNVGQSLRGRTYNELLGFQREKQVRAGAAQVRAGPDALAARARKRNKFGKLKLDDAANMAVRLEAEGVPVGQAINARRGWMAEAERVANGTIDEVKSSKRLEAGDITNAGVIVKVEKTELGIFSNTATVKKGNGAERSVPLTSLKLSPKGVKRRRDHARRVTRRLREEIKLMGQAHKYLDESPKFPLTDANGKPLFDSDMNRVPEPPPINGPSRLKTTLAKLLPNADWMERLFQTMNKEGDILDRKPINGEGGRGGLHPEIAERNRYMNESGELFDDFPDEVGEESAYFWQKEVEELAGETGVLDDMNDYGASSTSYGTNEMEAAIKAAGYGDALKKRRAEFDSDGEPVPSHDDEIFNKPEYTDEELSTAAAEIRELTQESLIARGLPEFFPVYRKTRHSGQDMDNVQFDPDSMAHVPDNPDGIISGGQPEVLLDLPGQPIDPNRVSSYSLNPPEFLMRMTPEEQMGGAVRHVVWVRREDVLVDANAFFHPDFGHAQNKTYEPGTKGDSWSGEHELLIRNGDVVRGPRPGAPVPKAEYAELFAAARGVSKQGDDLLFDVGILNPQQALKRILKPGLVVDGLNQMEARLMSKALEDVMDETGQVPLNPTGDAFTVIEANADLNAAIVLVHNPETGVSATTAVPLDLILQLENIQRRTSIASVSNAHTRLQQLKAEGIVGKIDYENQTRLLDELALDEMADLQAYFISGRGRKPKTGGRAIRIGSATIGIPQMPGRFKGFTGDSMKMGTFRRDTILSVAENTQEAGRYQTLMTLRKTLEAGALSWGDISHLTAAQLRLMQPIRMKNKQSTQHESKALAALADYQSKIGKASKNEIGEAREHMIRWQQEMFPDSRVVEIAEGQAVLEIQVAPNVWKPMKDIEADGGAVYGFVNQRSLGNLRDTTDNFGTTGNILRGVDAFNRAQILAILLLKPAYLTPNLIGQAALTFFHSGFMAPKTAAEAARLTHALKGVKDGPELMQAMRSGVQMGMVGGIKPARGLQGKVEKLSDTLIKGYSVLLDSPFRYTAWVHEARKLGYKTVDQQIDLLRATAGGRKGEVSRGQKPGEVVVGGAETAVTRADKFDDFVEIASRANDALVDYMRLSPFEQKYVRRALIFYPWAKGSTLYAGRFARDKPLTTAAILQLARQSNEDTLNTLIDYVNQQNPELTDEDAEKIAEVALRDLRAKYPGAFFSGVDEFGVPQTITPQAADLFGSPLEFVSVIRNLIQGGEFEGEVLANISSPVVGQLAQAVTGFDSFRRREIDQANQGIIPRIIGETVLSWPQARLVKGVFVNDNEELNEKRTLQEDKKRAALIYLISASVVARGLGPKAIERAVDDYKEDLEPADRAEFIVGNKRRAYFSEISNIRNGDYDDSEFVNGPLAHGWDNFELRYAALAEADVIAKEEGNEDGATFREKLEIELRLLATLEDADGDPLMSKEQYQEIRDWLDYKLPGKIQPTEDNIEAQRNSMGAAAKSGWRPWQAAYLKAMADANTGFKEQENLELPDRPNLP